MGVLDSPDGEAVEGGRPQKDLLRLLSCSNLLCWPLNAGGGREKAYFTSNGTPVLPKISNRSSTTGFTIRKSFLCS